MIVLQLLAIVLAVIGLAVLVDWLACWYLGEPDDHVRDWSDR